MDIAKSAETTFNSLAWISEIAFYILPALVGLVMILWGIFLNGWDWTLILVGLAIFLLFGYCTYQAVFRK